MVQDGTNPGQCGDWVATLHQDLRQSAEKKTKEIRLSISIILQRGRSFCGPQLHYCQDEKITFTRSRAYRKNDNCYIEQKNYTVVRRAVGYARYDTPQQLRLLNELYGHLRLYTNFLAR